MKTLLTLLLLVGTTIFAQLPSKLDDLKSKRDAAIKRIEDVYKDELKKLLNDPDIKGDAMLVTQINDELGIVIPVTENKSDPEWFIGINWVTASGSKFNFTKTGRVVQQHNKNLYNFKWKFIKDGVVKVTGDFRDSSNSTERYFQFLTDGTAKYGASLENMIFIKRE